MAKFLNRRVRIWLYSVAVALAALLVGYGVLTIEQSGLWLALFGALSAVAPVVALDNISDE